MRCLWSWGSGVSEVVLLFGCLYFSIITHKPLNMCNLWHSVSCDLLVFMWPDEDASCVQEWILWDVLDVGFDVTRQYLLWSWWWSCRSSWAAARPTSPSTHGNYNTRPAADPSLSEKTHRIKGEITRSHPRFHSSDQTLFRARQQESFIVTFSCGSIEQTNTTS